MAKPKTKKVKIVRKTKKIEGKSIEAETAHRTKIRVIGIGGGGCSVIAEVAPRVKKVDFIAANTDAQALKEAGRTVRIFQFGHASTGGLGCGMDPKIGKNAAEEAEQKIINLFKDVDLAILVSCLGGGTGSGSAPEFARIAKDLGVITLGIFTTPFKFEGAKRAQIAKASLERLKPYLNVFSIIPNENIFQIINKETPIVEAFSAINKRLADNLLGLVEMIYSPGIINIDFADLEAILSGKGRLAYLNSATGQGQSRSEEVLKALLKSPLSEYGIAGAEKILFNITASKDLTMSEVELISRTIFDFNRRARIIFGVSQDNNYGTNLRVALLAVGCGQEIKKKPKQKHKVRAKKEVLSAPSIKINAKPKAKKHEIKSPPGAGLPQKENREMNKKNPPKEEKKKKAETTAGIKQVPLLTEGKIFSRKNGLDLQKEAEETEQELFEEEKKWDTPAFLRREGS